LKVIVASGYSADIVSDERLVAQDVTYLPKPFDRATLATTVRECLAGKM